MAEKIEDMMEKISKMSTEQLRKELTRRTAYGVGDVETHLMEEEIHKRERDEDVKITLKNATSTAKLVKATWALAIVTAFLVFVTFYRR